MTLNLKTLVVISLVVFVVACSLEAIKRNHEDEYITCKDENGSSVDWFIIYKPPNMMTTENGTLMVYMDPRNPSWKRLDANIGQQAGNPLAATLKFIYEGDDHQNMHAMYNDRNHAKAGHTKGVINFDQRSGYWLVHSVPGFPVPKSDRRYSYVTTGRKYGQIFLCATLDYQQLDLIGKMLRHNQAGVYDHQFPLKFNKSNPNVFNAIHGKYINDENLFFSKLQTLKGQRLFGFAKSSSYGKDLWIEIAKTFNTTLNVQSWRQSQANFGPECQTNYSVENVLTTDVLENKFLSLNDHSKWAVSTGKQRKGVSLRNVHIMKQNWTPSLSLTCIGDINRQFGQLKRGGGAVCLDHPMVAKHFLKLIVKLDGCTPAKSGFV